MKYLDSQPNFEIGTVDKAGNFAKLEVDDKEVEQKIEQVKILTVQFNNKSVAKITNEYFTFVISLLNGSEVNWGKIVEEYRGSSNTAPKTAFTILPAAA